MTTQSASLHESLIKYLRESAGTYQSGIAYTFDVNSPSSVMSYLKNLIVRYGHASVWGLTVAEFAERCYTCWRYDVETDEMKALCRLLELGVAGERITR